MIYGSFRNGHFHIFWKPIDGSGSEEELVVTESEPFAYSVSPDGRWLSYNTSDSGGYLLPLAGERKPIPRAVAPIERSAGPSAKFVNPGGDGAISPDNRWLAYESDETGQDEVYVQPLSSGTGKWQISASGGLRPIWSPDGHELFFRSGVMRGTSALMSVAVQTEPTFSASTPKPLVTFRCEQAGHDYAVMPDGQHFICIKWLERETGATEVNVILNWASELKK